MSAHMGIPHTDMQERSTIYAMENTLRANQSSMSNKRSHCKTLHLSVFIQSRFLCSGRSSHIPCKPLRARRHLPPLTFLFFFPIPILMRQRYGINIMYYEQYLIQTKKKGGGRKTAPFSKVQLYDCSRAACKTNNFWRPQFRQLGGSSAFDPDGQTSVSHDRR